MIGQEFLGYPIRVYSGRTYLEHGQAIAGRNNAVPVGSAEEAHEIASAWQAAGIRQPWPAEGDLSEADLSNLITACATSEMRRGNAAWAEGLDKISAKLRAMREKLVADEIAGGRA